VVKLDAVDGHHKGMWLEEKESESDSSGRTQFPSTRLESSDDCFIDAYPTLGHDASHAAQNVLRASFA
jgi:hypothetical protein